MFYCAGPSWHNLLGASVFCSIRRFQISPCGSIFLFFYRWSRVSSFKYSDDFALCSIKPSLHVLWIGFGCCDSLPKAQIMCVCVCLYLCVLQMIRANVEYIFACVVSSISQFKQNMSIVVINWPFKSVAMRLDVDSHFLFHFSSRNLWREFFLNYFGIFI